MAVNHISRRQAPSGVLKNVCFESFRIFFLARIFFTTEGLNDPYGSKAMKEELTERTPPDACSNDHFMQLYFNYFLFLILSPVADRLELLIVNDAY